MKRILILFFPLCICGIARAHAQDTKTIEVKPNSLSYPVQPSASFWKTVYYDANWQTVKNKEEASYYRLPVIKDGERYEAEFFRKDGTRLKTCSYIPVVVNYQLNIDEGTGIKDGPFVFYDGKGQVETEGNYSQNKKVGEWKEYKNGKLSLTMEYKDGMIVSEKLAE